MSGPLTVLILDSNNPDFEKLKKRYDNVLFHARRSDIDNNYSISSTFSYDEEGKETKTDVHSYEIFSIVDPTSSTYDGDNRLGGGLQSSISPSDSIFSPPYNETPIRYGQYFMYKLPVDTSEITPEIYYERFRFHRGVGQVFDGYEKKLNWLGWKPWTGTIPEGIISPSNYSAWMIYTHGIEDLPPSGSYQEFPAGVTPPTSWMAVMSDTGEPYLYIGFFSYRINSFNAGYGADYLNVYYKLTQAEYEAGI